MYLLKSHVCLCVTSSITSPQHTLHCIMHTHSTHAHAFNIFYICYLFSFFVCLRFYLFLKRWWFTSVVPNTCGTNFFPSFLWEPYIHPSQRSKDMGMVTFEHSCFSCLILIAYSCVCHMRMSTCTCMETRAFQ